MANKVSMENENRFFIYGRQPVLEALRSETQVLRLILAKDAKGAVLNRIKQLAERKKVPVTVTEKNELQKFVGAVVHQGAVAEVSRDFYINEDTFRQILQSRKEPFILILDQIQDTHNLGAIIRTAEIGGVDAIVLPEKGSAGINATVAKTSAGAVFNLRFYQTDDLTGTLDWLRTEGVRTAALVPGSQQTLYGSDLTGPLALLIGNEGQGVRKNLLPFCQITVTIPQFGRVNSLNASVSAAVVLFEAIRQRMFKS